MPEFDSSIEYRQIPGFENYMVGNDGTVWSKFVVGGQGSIGKWRRLKGSRLHAGHLKVALSKNGIVTHIQIHQIVMLAFVGICPSGMQIRHLNGISCDNRLCNLAYGTAKENMADKYLHGTDLRGSKHHSAILKENQVLEIRKRLKSGETSRAIADDYGVSRSCISMIASNLNWTHLKEEK